MPFSQASCERVIRTVAAHLGVRPSEISLDSNLRDDLQADLLDRIELSVTVEEQFGVRLPLDAAMQAQTVRDLIGILENAIESCRAPVVAERED